MDDGLHDDLQADLHSTLLHVLTCYPADFMVGEVASDPGRMRSQTVTQQMDPFPGQVQLILQGR